MNSKGNQIPSALIVVAPRDFRDEEYLDVHAQLVEAGFLVQVASTQTGRIKGLFGTWIEADLSLSQAKASQFDAVVFVGGDKASIYFSNQTALNLAQSAADLGIVLGALCIAPVILGKAGVLKDCRATCYPTYRNELQGLGAVVCDDPVVIDGWLVTADGPMSAKAFALAVVDRVNLKRSLS